MSDLKERFAINTKERTPCIYAILNEQNFKLYVGKSEKPNIRFRQHIFSLKSGNHPNSEMQKDFDKGHNFSFCRLRSCNKDDKETMR